RARPGESPLKAGRMTLTKPTSRVTDAMLTLANERQAFADTGRLVAGEDAQPHSCRTGLGRSSSFIMLSQLNASKGREHEWIEVSTSARLANRCPHAAGGGAAGLERLRRSAGTAATCGAQQRSGH